MEAANALPSHLQTAIGDAKHVTNQLVSLLSFIVKFQLFQTSPR
jgi:hypothetical protein